MSATVEDSPVESLRKTRKGKLNYNYPWEAYSSPEKMALLSSMASPPTFSPEALDLITNRTARLSFEQPNDDNSSVSSIPGEAPPHTSTPTAPPPIRTDVSMETKTLQHGPLLDEENPDESQDDLLMHEAEETVTLGRKLFKKSHSRPLNLTYTLPQAGEFPGYDEVSVIEQSRQELKEYSEDMDRELEEELETQVMQRRVQVRKERERMQLETWNRYEQDKALREAHRREQQRQKEEDELRHQQDSDRRMQQLMVKYQEHRKLVQATLKLGEERKQEFLKIQAELRRKEAQRRKLLNDCRQYREESVTLANKFIAMYAYCRYPQLLPSAITENFKSAITKIAAIQSSLAYQEAGGDPEEWLVGKHRAQLTAFLPYLSELKAAVESVNERGDQESLLAAAAKKLAGEEQGREEEKAKDFAAKREQKEPQQPGVAKNEAEKEAVQETSEDKTALSSHIPKSMQSVYDHLQENMAKTIYLYSDLATSKDPQLKKYRFDLQKAVTSTVNTISRQSGEHLLEVIAKFKRVLSGQRVEVTGKSLSVSQHPHAKLYCSNLLAKKIVQQGEEQVASQADSAFPIAAVAVGVWSAFPDVGELILAHFHSSCPALVPFYIPRADGMSEADHMRLQGYKVSGSGVVESEDIFLKRMTGITRLYAAIIQTAPLHPGKPHPHGLEHGWAWLARVLNMEPQPSITATVLYDFLEIAGHALMRKYGRQFQKVLFVLCKEYIKKIEKVTPPTQQGPLSRLSQFLEECISRGKIPVPKGYLTPGFWRTRSEGIAVA